MHSLSQQKEKAKKQLAQRRHREGKGRMKMETHAKKHVQWKVIVITHLWAILYQEVKKLK